MGGVELEIVYKDDKRNLSVRSEAWSGRYQMEESRDL